MCTGCVQLPMMREGRMSALLPGERLALSPRKKSLGQEEAWTGVTTSTTRGDWVLKVNQAHALQSRSIFLFFNQKKMMLSIEE